MFNLILGSGSMGGALAEHPDVAGISFTGGQSTGAQVAKAAMSHNARVQLEMGGKNPLVVLDDCDLDRAVQCALDGALLRHRPALHGVEPHHRARRASTTASSTRWPRA